MIPAVTADYVVLLGAFACFHVRWKVAVRVLQQGIGLFS
jgi:hypothetical protein